MDNKVYIIKCPDYNNTGEKIRELVSKMGGIKQFAKSKENIVLKVNLLQPAEPEQAVSTHPSIVGAVAGMIKKAGASAVITDSPGTGYKYNEKTLRTVYDTCGMTEAAKKSGAVLNFDTTYRTVSYPKGRLIKHFEVITPIYNADGIINLCKLKTHLFMSMTGAVKNSFGIIPGLAKPGYHANLADKMRFADMLLDLIEYMSPRISIMDAVIGMEGEGPGAAGTPRHIGLLLGSTNPLALDIVAAEIIGLSREQNPLLIAAEKRGLAPNKIADVEIIGPDIKELRIQDYKFPSTIHEGSGLENLSPLHKLIQPLFKKGLARTPHIIKQMCIACGICRDSCPMKVISIIGTRHKYANIDDKKCIRCYCCHELCPQKAVELKESFLYRRIMK